MPSFDPPTPQGLTKLVDEAELLEGDESSSRSPSRSPSKASRSPSRSLTKEAVGN